MSGPATLYPYIELRTSDRDIRDWYMSGSLTRWRGTLFQFLETIRQSGKVKEIVQFYDYRTMENVIRFIPAEGQEIQELKQLADGLTVV